MNNELNKHKKYLHISFLIKGGKVVGNFCQSGFSGRGKQFDNQYDVDIIPSTHAERAALCSVPTHNHKQLKRCKIYSIAFRKIEGKICVHHAKPCKTCCKMMEKAGITKCYYSEANNNNLFFCNPASILKQVDSSIGLKILNIKKYMKFKTDYVLTIKNPNTFRLIEKKQKQIEGRVWRGSIRTLKPGMVITVKCNNHSLDARINGITKYKNFFSLLKTKLSKTLPTINNVNRGVEYYHSFYSKNAINKHGIVAIHLVPLF